MLSPTNQLHVLYMQDRDLVVQELEQQQGLNSRMERDVERFKNREQLLAKVSLTTDGCLAMPIAMLVSTCSLIFMCTSIIIRSLIITSHRTAH